MAGRDISLTVLWPTATISDPVERIRWTGLLYLLILVSMGMLQVHNLTKKFGDFTAVDHVSFEAQAGEIFGILGPNGAGKTTTLRVIATVLEATEGTATVDGHDITTDSEEVRKTIGVLTAEIGLYDRFTARENLRYFGQLYGMRGQQLEDRIDEIITLLHMERFADRRAGKFSTGMKQKVAIGRSIIHDPKVIIFDEPTAGLDVLASQTVVSFMQQAREMGKLVVLSTHDMFDAEKLCDRVVIIHRGKVVGQGSVDELKSQTGQDTLEAAFTHIVGDEAAFEAERMAEEKQLRDSKKGKPSLSVPKLTMVSPQVIRYGGVVFLLAGVALINFQPFGIASLVVGYVVLGVGVLGALAGKYLMKKQ